MYIVIKFFHISNQFVIFKSLLILNFNQGYKYFNEYNHHNYSKYLFSILYNNYLYNQLHIHYSYFQKFHWPIYYHWLSHTSLLQFLSLNIHFHLSLFQSVPYFIWFNLPISILLYIYTSYAFFLIHFSHSHFLKQLRYLYTTASPIKRNWLFTHLSDNFHSTIYLFSLVFLLTMSCNWFMILLSISLYVLFSFILSISLTICIVFFHSLYFSHYTHCVLSFFLSLSLYVLCSFLLFIFLTIRILFSHSLYLSH